MRDSRHTKSRASYYRPLCWKQILQKQETRQQVLNINTLIKQLHTMCSQTTKISPFTRSIQRSIQRKKPRTIPHQTSILTETVTLQELLPHLGTITIDLHYVRFPFSNMIRWECFIHGENQGMWCYEDKMYETPDEAVLGVYLHYQRLVMEHAALHLRGRCAWCEETWRQEEDEDEGYSGNEGYSEN
jgi:hypothetical protein